MPRPSINQIRSFSGLALSYRWNIQFTKFPAVGTYPDTEELNLRCETTEFPKMTIEPAEVLLRGHKVTYPGRGDIQNTITVAFIETDDFLINSIADEWMKAVYEQVSGKVGVKKEIEGTISMYLLDTEENRKYYFTLYGAWISDLDRGTGEAGGAEPFRPQITFTFDYFESGKVE